MTRPSFITALRTTSDGTQRISLEAGYWPDPDLRVMVSVPDNELYGHLRDPREYDLQLLDGALVQVRFEFQMGKPGDLQRSRLAYLPAPDLTRFQVDSDMYLNEAPRVLCRSHALSGSRRLLASAGSQPSNRYTSTCSRGWCRRVRRCRPGLDDPTPHGLLPETELLRNGRCRGHPRRVLGLVLSHQAYSSGLQLWIDDLGHGAHFP